MRTRDRQELFEFRKQLAEEEQVAEEARMRPVREAEERLSDTQRKLADVERSRLEGRVKDPAMFVSTEVATAQMTEADAEAHNGRALREFIASHPAFFPSESNLVRIGAYFDANGLHITTPEMLQRVVERMTAAYMLEERPQQIEPEPQESPAPVEAVPITYAGINLETGKDAQFTAWQVERMSADEFRRRRIVL